jgi:deferrochelatase/peroxidase EfeB
MEEREGGDERTAEPQLRSSEKIQGNILAAFNKPFQAFLFLNFRNDGASAREWLGSLLGQNRIATTKAVAKHNDDRKNKSQTWLAVSLTRSGLVTLHPELAADLSQFHAFSAGPLGTRHDGYGNATTTTTAALLGDKGGSDPQEWVIGGPRHDPVDAIVTLAADEEGAAEDEEATLNGLVNALVKQAGEYAETRVGKLLVLRDLRGKAPGKRDDQDPFTFKEGVSQPGVLGFTREKRRRRRLEDADHPGSPIIATGEFLLGYPGERRVELRARPLSTPGWMHDGSFQVFRRLTRKPGAWESQLTDLKDEHGIDGLELTAKAIGRRPDGCPLAPDAGCDPANPKTLNDFDYAADPDGVDTPLFAHIRRMNPRDERVFYRAHRLLRRGIPYENSDDDRGLLFNAFMASIEDQFEYLMRYWANALGDYVAGAGDGPDPLLGSRVTPETRWLLRLPSKPVQPLTSPRFVEATGAVYSQPRPSEHKLQFSQVVRTTGAVYAFAPSIPTLRQLVLDPSQVKIKSG